ncbi:MAG: hypothetical protein KZQ63_01975 [Candidatus Thiodiazotropha sp. (ex Lucinoma aequizonata)]|nr:hypothetical protein [Candidatus Thiodiazotropha sp. (ex Lucinoma aequizonata)]
MLAPLIVSDYVFSPFIANAYEISGVTSLLLKVKEVQAKQNKKLKFLRSLINCFNRRNKDQVQIVEAMRKKLGSNVMPCTVGDRTAIANTAHRKASVWHKAKGEAAKIASKEMWQALTHIIEQMNLPRVK